MKKNIGLLLMSISLLSACDESYSPKPRGYFRIEFPEKKYQLYSSDCPFSFQHPIYSIVKNDSTDNPQYCWLNVEYPQFNGIIHLSYKAINKENTLYQLTEDCRKLAYKHTIKAEGISEFIINKNKENVHGILYDIKGNTASSIQFFVTDSTNHFLRGALYFKEEPRIDSLQPVVDFIHKDINQMLNSLEWKN